MSDNSKIIEITTKVEDIFPKDMFSMQIMNSNKFSIKTGKDNCLEIIIKESLLYINFLSKCGINGTESLRRIEEAVKNIPYITDIGLQDGSEIYFCDYRFNLAFLKILTKGQSWYNSLGYISKDYEMEKSHNKQIIELSCVDFIEELFKKKVEIFMEKNSKEKMSEIIEKLKNDTLPTYVKIRNKYISDLENYEAFVEKKIAKINESINYYRDKIHYFEDPHNSIKTEFNKLWKKISENNKCDDPIVEWINNFLEFIIGCKIFKYNVHLSKHMIEAKSEMVAKGNRKKNNSRKRKTCKRKTCKTKTRKTKK
jgi:hypothetical protein